LLHKLDELARDDAKVRVVFEHLRNLTIAVGLLAAATWLQINARGGWLAFWDHLSAATVAFAGLALVWINHANLFSKIAGRRWAPWIKVACALLYAAIVGAMIRFLERT
jgi:uncharacterized membrane protein SirB2